MRNLKIDVRQENGYSPLNVKKKKNNWGVTNAVMFAYVHTKIDILLSFLSIFFLSMFYEFNVNIQGFIY